MKVCVVCGAEFEARGNRKKCCSPACGRENHKRKNRESWRRRNPQKIVQKYCVECGAVFFVPAQQWKKLTCGDECQQQYYAKYRRKNRERIRVNGDAWRKRNPERAREHARQSRDRQLAKDPEKIRRRQQRYDAKRAAALKLVRELKEKGLEALL